MTNGWTNWYRVVRSSRSVGENSPADQSSGYGTEVNLGAGAPATTADRCASSRAVGGGGWGAGPRFPPPRRAGASPAPRGAAGARRAAAWGDATRGRGLGAAPPQH